MTNQILDDDFTPITLESLRFKGKLYAKKLKYDKRIEYLEKMRVLLFVIPIFFIFPMLIHFISETFDSYYLMETLIITAIFCLAGFLFNKNRLAVLISISIFLFLLIVLLFSTNILPLKEVAALILIGIGIVFYFNAKSLEKELITAYKAGDENAYLKS